MLIYTPNTVLAAAYGFLKYKQGCLTNPGSALDDGLL